MPRSIFIGICILIGSILACSGTLSWAVNDGSNQIDLMELTHPDIFEWQFEAKPVAPNPVVKADKPTPAPPQEEEESAPPERKIGHPIPLDQLDNSLIQRVHFDYDKSKIKQEALEGIKINAAWLKNHPEYDILLEGHCDERGSNEYNLALGERRASAVFHTMKDLGIDPDRVVMRSWGEEKPLDLRKTPKAYALNRRVEFYAIPK
jgi:peptidoglycan-associated lipoprotein